MRLLPAASGGPGPLFAEVDRFLVPVDDPPLVAFFHRHLFVPHTLRERLACELLAALPAAARGRFLARRCRLWRVAADGDRCRRQHRGSDAGDRFARAVALLGAALESGDVGDAPGSETRWILLADYPQRRRGRAVAFLFPPRTQQAEAARPSAVIKLHPNEEEGVSLAREADALDEIRRRLPDELARTLPEALARWESPCGEALWLEALPGRSAYVEQARSPAPASQVARHLDAAARWLGLFHLATRLDLACSLSPVAEGCVASPTGETPAWYRELASELARKRLPLAAGHGDFWARNLLLTLNDGEALPSVVDWESYRPAAPPWEDLFHFVLSYVFHHRWRGLGRRSPREAFRLAFLTDGFVSRCIRRYFDCYCEVTGTDPSLLAPLFRLYLLEREPSAAAPAATAPATAGVEKGLFSWCYLALEGTDRSAFSG